MTLRPGPEVVGNLQPLTTRAETHGVSYHWFIDIAGNIAVFIPLGWCAVLAYDAPLWQRGLAGILVGAGLSLGIELTQLTLPSRVSSWEDWVLNTLGAGIGAGIAVGMLAIRRYVTVTKSKSKSEKDHYDRLNH